MSGILIIGSLNTDLISTAPRCPSAGETLLSTSFSSAPGGKGLNQCVAAARLCAPPSTGPAVRMLGRVGGDSFGQDLLSFLSRSGVDVRHVHTVPDSPSGVAVIIVEELQGENRILVSPGANAVLGPEHVVGEELWADVGLVVLQCEIPLPTAIAGIAEARRRGVRVVFNPAPAPSPSDVGEILSAVDVLVVNETEAATLTELPVSTLDTSEGVERAAALLKHKGAGAVVVTLGARGCYWTSGESGPCGWQDAMKVGTVVDTTGAGDTFVGALAVGLREGRELAESVRFAARAAGVAVTKVGATAGIPTREEVERR